MIYRGRCWYTYDFVVTYKLRGTDRYVGYTGFKAEFRGDSQYEPASAMAVWELSGGQTTQPSGCQPAIKTGIGALDNVLFCVGNYGITLLVIIIAFFMLLLLLRR